MEEWRFFLQKLWMEWDLAKYVWKSPTIQVYLRVDIIFRMIRFVTMQIFIQNPS